MTVPVDVARRPAPVSARRKMSRSGMGASRWMVMLIVESTPDAGAAAGDAATLEQYCMTPTASE